MTLQVLPYDVHREICDYLVYLQTRIAQPEGAGRGLVSLARSCRRLNEPAVDAIWYTLPSIAVLALSLPEDLLEMEETFDDGDRRTQRSRSRFTVSFTRGLVDSDIVRLNRYACRVREVKQKQHLHNSCSVPPYTLAETALRALDAFLHGRSLLPSLRAIMIYASEPPYATDTGFLPSSLYRLLGPTVETLRVEGRDGTPSPHITHPYETLFEKLPQLAPHLASLNVALHPSSRDQVYHPRFRITTALSNAILGLHSLEEVHTGNHLISSQALFHLGRLRGLRILQVRLADTPTDASAVIPECEDRSRRLFHVLHEVILEPEHELESTIATLRSITSPDLISIKILVHDAYYSLDSVDRLFAQISMLVGLPNLKTIVFKDHNRRNDLDLLTTHAHEVDPDTFRPLLSLSSVETFIIDSSIPWAVTDRLLGSFALAWPKLRHLELVIPTSIQDGETPSRATLAGLEHLALGCPNLETLNIELDLATPSVPPRNVPVGEDEVALVAHALSVGGVGQRKLSTLIVRCTPLSDVEVVAARLGYMFPCVAKIVDLWPFAAGFDSRTTGLRVVPLVTVQPGQAARQRIEQSKKWREVRALVVAMQGRAGLD